MRGDIGVAVDVRRDAASNPELRKLVAQLGHRPADVEASFEGTAIAFNYISCRSGGRCGQKLDRPNTHPLAAGETRYET